MTTLPTPQILMTGANGLVGSVLVRDFTEHYQFTNLDLSGSPSVDITNVNQINGIFSTHPAEWVIHCAAFTDVTAAWQQTGDKQGSAYQVNVAGTENIVRACERYQKKLIHLSTAYVFSGDNVHPYNEQDQTGPVEWYGQTKLWAEEAIRQSSAEWVILRLDNPFRRDAFTKPDAVRRILTKLKDNSLPPQFNDAFFGPTSIEDLAKVIDWVMRTDKRGLFHATANESWTSFDFARAIAKKAGIDPNLVREGSLTEYLKTSNRPYPRNTALDCTKLVEALDFTLQMVEQALEQVIL